MLQDVRNTSPDIGQRSRGEGAITTVVQVECPAWLEIRKKAELEAPVEHGAASKERLGDLTLLGLLVEILGDFGL